MKLRYAQFSQENLRIRFFFPKGIIDMNSTFKVVFNKARGALMVVNEVTSSVQAKGTKTVVAAAVATMIAGVAGTAMAAEWEVAPGGLEAATDTVITDANWAAIKDQNAFELTASDKEAKKPWASVAKDQTFDKTLWVSGAGAKAHASGFGVSGEKVKFTNKGTIYVTSGKDGVNYQNDAIWAGNGATAINEGKIVAKDAYGMRVGTGDTASKIVNNGSIYVESTGAGMELGGAANSEAVNNGLISVGDVKQALDFGHGVLIQDQTGAKFTNNGTITAGKGATAIEVKGNVNNTALNFGAKSDVNGLVHLAAGKTTLKFDGTVDTMKIKTEQQEGKAAVAAHLDLQNNANITLEDGQKSTYETVTLDDSRLNASIWGADNTFKTVTVNEGSIFNITKLNSRVDLKSDADLPKDQLLIARDQSFTYDHAQMHVAGKVFTGNLKVGTLDQKGTVTLKGGEHNFSNLIVGANGSAFNLGEKAVVTVGGLHLYHGEGTAGKVVVNDSTLINTGALTFEPIADKYTAAGTLKLENGTFQTAATDFFKKKEAAAAEAAAQPEYEATGNAAFLSGNGTLNLTSTAFEYSLADLEKAQNLIDSKNTIRIVFANGTLKLGEGEKLDATSVSGRILAPYTGEADTDGSFAITDRATVGAIDFSKMTDKTAKSVALNNGDNTLTLAGNGGDVFKNLGATVATVETGKLVLGTAGNSGNVNVDTLKATELTVAGDFTARAVEATTAKIDGILTANSVKTTDATNGAKVTGALVLTGNVKKDVSELTGKVTVTDRGVLTTNRAAGLAYAAEYADEDLSVAYVDRQLKLAEGAVINIGEAPATGALAAATTTDRTVNVNANGIYGIDAASFLYTGKPAAEADLSVFGNSTALNFNGGEVEILNITKLGQIDLGGAIKNTANIDIDTDSIYVVVNDNGVDATTGVVTLSYNDGLVADKTVDARLKDAFTKGVGAKEMAILSALDTPAFFNDETGKFTADGNKALEQATGGNATAGVLNVAYDANAQVTDAIVRHQLSEHAGMGVWADVFYAKNEAKKLYGDFGYSADIYGGVLGFDYTAACGGTLGAALTVGTADADSEGGALSNSLSSDFVGLSVYASKDFSGLNVKADLGYIDFSNDFTGLGDASDATTITFGVRGDFTAYQNGAFSVVPHMGLRYTRIDTDAVAFNDEQNMNVLEAPIGVKFAGTFEATGWKLVPSYDFTIVPQLGDKEVEAFGTAGDITILSGGLFNNVLGVEAVKDNMSFGLNASYGFGPDDRANTQVNANFRYHF